MKIRENLEKREEKTLSPYAVLSSRSKGRDRDEELCDIRPCFQRDRDRILYSKSFRRLKDKTQVFLTPDGDHYRTRMTHTLEVAQNARTLARALRLNEDLCEAIALGHDLGHTLTSVDCFAPLAMTEGAASHSLSLSAPSAQTTLPL